MKLKKRIVGFLLLLGIILILVPLLFGRSIPSDELKLSAHIPAAPPKPKIIDAPIPPQNTTVPEVTPEPTLSAAETTVIDNAVTTDASLNEIAPLASPAAPATIPVPPAPTIAPVLHAPNKQQEQYRTAPPKAIQHPVEETPLIASTAPVAVSEPTPPQPVTSKLTKIIKTAPKEFAKKKPTIPAGAHSWVVQAGSFADKHNAEKLVKKLQTQGLTAYMHSQTTSNKTINKVLVGPFLQQGDAEKVKAQLKKEFNLEGMLMKVK